MTGRYTRGVARALALVIALTTPLAAQDLGSVRLGAPLPEDLPDPIGQEVQGPFAYALWRRPDGTAMSVTSDARTGSTLYIEIWNAEGGPRPAPLPGLSFGQTTQADLVARFGSEGIVFAGRGRAAALDERAAIFTTYEIEGSSAVLSFVSLMPLAQASPDTAGQARLDAVILAHGPYLDTIWGANRGRLEGYRPIPDPFAD
ncbi:hypothetical protein roselon_03133 [Roseibacterium elongatum DSM 19469]|uniref:Uncharacterized protein n=1 Tax=Roseicyclus elongatus DSM 19469 TaxID=1294273 RepID=W8RW60_9RHOB|nr:hypothetical protein [Roseibacterium elongatum]AHM05404.1 hypothetical protein roselon_03133 [Roseibacterium elongatum DSM 19469]